MNTAPDHDAQLATVLGRFSQAARDQIEGVTAQLLASKLIPFSSARLKPLRDNERRITRSASTAAKHSRLQKLRRLARRASR